MSWNKQCWTLCHAFMSRSGYIHCQEWWQMVVQGLFAQECVDVVLCKPKHRTLFIGMPFCLVISIVALWLICTDQDVQIVRKLDLGVAIGQPEHQEVGGGGGPRGSQALLLGLDCNLADMCRPQSCHHRKLFYIYCNLSCYVHSARPRLLITPYLQFIGHFLQTSLQVLTALHQILDIINVGEVDLQQVKKVSLLRWHVGVGQDFEHVTKVVCTAKERGISHQAGLVCGPVCTPSLVLVAFTSWQSGSHNSPVEGDPPDVLTENNAWCHEQFREVCHVTAITLVLCELDATVLQQIYRVLCIHVFSERTQPLNNIVVATGKRHTKSSLETNKN